MRFSLPILVFCLTAACSSKTKDAVAAETKELPAASDKAVKAVNKAAADVAQTAEAVAAKVDCSTKGDNRTLELRPKGKGCEVAYTKNGQEGIVASSANGSAYCETTMNKIRERLKGSGFECK